MDNSSRERKCYIFVDEEVRDLGRTSPTQANAMPDKEDNLKSPSSRRRRRSFVAALIKKAVQRDPCAIVEICVGEQQKLHPVEIPDACLIVISWDVANGDGGRGSDQTLQFFATEGRSRVNDALNPYTGHGAVLFCECQTVQGLPVQAAYDAIFGAGEISMLKDPLKAEFRFGSQARPAKFWHRIHPLFRGYEWPMHEAFAINVPHGGNLQLFAPDVYELPDKSSPVDHSPLIHYRRESLWFGWFTEWKRGWVPILIADFSARAETEYDGRPEIPAIMLAKKTAHGYMLASTVWLAGMPAVGRFLHRLQDPDWESIGSYHRRVRLSQITTDSISSLIVLAVTVLLSVLIVRVTFGSSADGLAKDLIVSSGLSVISIFNVGVVRGWRRIWKRPYGISTIRWFLYPLRSFRTGRQSTWK